MNNKGDFSKGSISKNILSVALPLMFSQLVTLLYNIVDRIYIGRIQGEGTLALTGLGLCFPIIMMISAFANLYSFGGAPLFSIERGRKNDKEASYIMGNSFCMIIITAVLFMFFCLLFKKPILYFFGASDMTYSYANSYITIYLLGTIFSMISLGMNYFLNAQGLARLGMIISLISAVINIGLDPVFIFLLNMGVKGAALASVISQIVSCIWIILILRSKKAVISLEIKSMILNFNRIKNIISLGMSGFIMSFTNAVTQVACSAMLSIYGGDIYVGVMTILNSVREVVTVPVVGLTDGASPVVSYNYGAQEYSRLKRAMVFMIISCILYTSCSWTLIYFFPSFFVNIFTSEAKLIKHSIPAIKIFFFGFCAMALQFSGQRMFVSLGKSKYAIFFSLFRKVIIVLPLTIYLPKVVNLGVNGVFLAEPISNVIGGACCFITMLLTVLPEINQKEKEKNKLKVS